MSGVDFIFKKNIKLPEKVFKSTTPAHKQPSSPKVTQLSKPQEEISKIDVLRDKYANCSKCSLAKTRKHFVYGNGNPNADIMIIGEGPGAKEDATGRVFVGPAGELLTKMLSAINIDRNDVFISNIVKCRPPHNRDPLPDEKEACLPYLIEQIKIIKPKVIVLLGKVAATTLIEEPKGNTLRFYRSIQNIEYCGIKTFVTYHPSALLHNPSFKLDAWHDLQWIKHYIDENK